MKWSGEVCMETKTKNKKSKLRLFDTKLINIWKINKKQITLKFESKMII